MSDPVHISIAIEELKQKYPEHFGVTRMTQPELFKRTKRPPRAKKAGKLNAAQRTMKYLRDRGWTCEVTERYVSRVAGKGQQAKFAGGYRRDLYGFVDVLCFRPDPVEIDGKMVLLLAVQTTSRIQISPHIRSYRDVDVYVGRGSPEQMAKKRTEHAELLNRLRRWIQMPGAAFVVHGWEPLDVPKKKGGMKVQWTLTERIVTLDDLVEPKF